MCSRDGRHVGCVWLAAGVGLSAAAQSDHPEISFSRHIQPIIQAHCAKCHTGGQRKGGLSLDTRAAMLEEDGIIVPGNSEDSRLIELVRGDDPLLAMPPEGDRLSEEEIALLAMWIDQGAKWDVERFEMVVRVEHVMPRAVEAPAPRDGITHPIDLILADYFEAREIGPSPVINDAAFLRRAYLDLSGLLPTIEELDAFIEDRDPDRRSRVIDKLLDDNHAYAEHWLTFWNDLLRNDYAGTGYIDGGRTQITEWLYESLRANKPYDAFVRELVNPNDRSRGFANGIRWRGDVNASQRRELQYSQNVAQVFLGINMKCASCHDSFIDGWKLRDAYGLAAIIAEGPLELHRCDVPTGEFAQPAFVFPEIAQIDPDADRAERLAQFADLMTRPENGRLTRTIVNRIWARMMGRGLVEPVDTMANAAWNEDVLDYLANLLVESEYDLKVVIRTIATSRAYQREPGDPPSPPGRGAGGEGAFLFYGPSPQRMTAEQFVDAVWMLTSGGPGEKHTSVGSRVRASLVNADRLMRILGRPMREQVVTTRPNELTTLQALELTNGEIISDLLKRGGEMLASRFDRTDDLINSTYRAALARDPSESELKLAREFVGESPRAETTADFLWSIIMLPEFQMVR